MPRAHPSRRVQISKDENGNIGFVQGDHISNDIQNVKKKPGKFKQLKMMANQVIEEGTKTLLRVNAKRYSVRANENADVNRSKTQIPDLVPEEIRKELRFFKDHVNLSDENSAPFPKCGIIQETICRGQHALDLARNAYSTYSFKGWKILTDAFFMDEDDNPVCLALTKDRKWILRASCKELLRLDNQTKRTVPEGLMIQLTTIWSASRITAQWEDDGDISRLHISTRSNNLKFTFLSESNYLKDKWRETIPALVNNMTEMQIEIISQNFHEYMNETPPQLFLPSSGQQIEEDEEDIIVHVKIDNQALVNENHTSELALNGHEKQAADKNEEFYMFPITRKISQESTEIHV